MGHFPLATPLFTARDKGFKNEKKLIKFGLHKIQSEKMVPCKTEKIELKMKYTIKGVKNTNDFI